MSALVYAIASWLGNRALAREVERRARLPRRVWLWHNYYGWGCEYDPTLPYPPRAAV